MTRPAADSVAVLWVGTGQGTMSLGANVSGRQAFPASANGLPVSYEIEHQTAPERENGIGIYTSAGNTLTRDTITFSTAGGTTRVNFSAGDKHVRLSALVHDVVENRDATDPTVNDDITLGYIAGRSRWLNTSTSKLWFCVNHTDGAAEWAQLGTGGGGGGLTVTSVKTSSYTAAANEAVRTNSAGGPLTVTLPAGTDGAVVVVEDTTDSWPIHPVTLITPGSPGPTINSFPGDPGISLDGGNRIEVRYNATATNWDVVTVTGPDAQGFGLLAELHAVTIDEIVGVGTRDATTCLQGNGEFGLKDPIQVSGGEITAGTATALRSYSPANIVSFIVQHAAGGGGGLTLTNDANTAVTIGNAINGTHRRLTAATAITLTLDAQASVGTRVAATPAGAGTVTVQVEVGATYYTGKQDQSVAGAIDNFVLGGYTEFECHANADGNSAKWRVDGDIALSQSADGAPIVDYTLPHVSSVSGTLNQAAHGGRALLITGTVTVPIANGFVAILRNKSGSSRTVQPASGNLIHEGTTKATISLPNNREIAVHSDGTDVWVAGALA